MTMFCKREDLGNESDSRAETGDAADLHRRAAGPGVSQASWVGIPPQETEQVWNHHCGLVGRNLVSQVVAAGLRDS